MATQEKKQIKQPIKVLIGLTVGIILGLILQENVKYIAFIGDIFLNLLKMCILPLILLSIITGISQVADIRRLKKVGIGFAVYAVGSTMLASTVGISLGKLLNLGEGITLPDAEAVAGVAEDTDIISSFVNWIPTNPFTALSDGNTIQIIVFAIIFGIILAGAKDTPAGETVFLGVTSLNEIIARIIGWVITLTPYGVCALIAETVGTTGLDVMGEMGKLLLALYVGMLIMILIIYPVIFMIFVKENPIKFFKNTYPVFIMALSTCSSSATLPITLKIGTEKNGVPKDVANIVGPLAATINMDGAALEHPMYVIFAAQMFGIDLSLPQIFLLVLLGVVISAGSAGMPGSGIVMATLMLEIMGLPLTMIPWLTGIYVFIDLVSTLTNVTGDCVGMCVISNYLGEMDHEAFNA